MNERLQENLSTKDSNEFWKAIRRSKEGGESLVTRVNGETSEMGIANSFRDHFRRVYTHNDAAAHELLKQTFLARFDKYYHDHL